MYMWKAYGFLKAFGIGLYDDRFFRSIYALKPPTLISPRSSTWCYNQSRYAILGVEMALLFTI